MKICAVIPAAGRGTRLNGHLPKLLAPLIDDLTAWSLLRQKLSFVDHIHIIASPEGSPFIQSALLNDLNTGFVSMSIQPNPMGMGDAIFQGASVWSAAKRILIVWSDQVFVSEDTFRRALLAHTGRRHHMVLPLTRVASPYVEYLFDSESHLIGINQSREQDQCTPNGLSDVGTFVLSVPDLLPQWNAYTKQAKKGSVTHEINFLPFFPYLARQGWSIDPLMVSDPIEAHGINTPEDLLFFQKNYGDLYA